MNRFGGILTALVTPFKNGAVDLESFERLVRWQIEQGVDGFVINGTTGESPTLQWPEVVSLYERARGIAGEKFNIIIGTGSNSTSSTISTTKKAAALGADGALVVVPYYNKPQQLGMQAHFTEVADASEIPVLLYNVPGRTLVSLELSTVQALSKHKNIVGIKEASGDINFGQEIKNFCGPEFLLSSGDDSSAISLILNGGEGIISVISHIIPKSLKEIAALARDGQNSAIEEYRKFDKLNYLLGIESNPIPVKMALYLMKIIDSPELRLPLTRLSEQNESELRKELQKLGVLDG